MKSIALGFHDIEEIESGSWDPARPGRGRYALDKKKLREHLEKVDECGGGARVGLINSSGAWEGDIPIFLTFDDGAIGSYTCAASELEARDWRGHFLITTDWIGQPGFLTPEQIRDLHGRGHVIGSHTCSHPARMSSLTWAQLRREWSTSRAILSDIVRSDVTVASVSNGYYSRTVAEAAAASGIKVLFTSEPTVVASDVSGCLVVGRYSVLGSSPSELSARLALGSKVAQWRQSVAWQVKKAVKTVAGPYYTAVRLALLHGAGKSGPSAERAQRAAR
jgi:peptidoglycan/xylan/chitin deacetylase (PgdA/CDA1 family)